MQITLTINGEKKTLETTPHERLLRLLRREGYFSVKFGDEHGLSGADTILLDGEPVNAQTMLAIQAHGHHITTLEGIGSSRELHPLQQAFIETGAIQSGYNTPAQILVAYALLQHNPNPTETEVRAALSGVLDRETGYIKPVDAVLRAAAVMRGEEVPPKPEPKVDAVKLAAGKPVYADDIEMRGMLHAAMLTSPHAHARITNIDASRARALPGVHAVLTTRTCRA
jgi:putative selenate reductase molybdopterin-binding subunit